MSRRVSFSMSSDQVLLLRDILSRLRSGVVDARVILNQPLALSVNKLIVRAAAVASGETPQARKKSTHCKRGHEYSPENLLPSKDGRRQCRTCHRAAKSAWDKKRARERREARERERSAAA